MDEEDLVPKTRKPAPRNLDPMSIDALEAYIAELETEIARARATIATKSVARRSADSFFR
ncbi:MAG: DUF1192 domain-containing protein [Alphaproteobacteria bacterium]|nr:DUF1192 domain-containing protein [Alphaproteobacteria bacterium]